MSLRYRTVAHLCACGCGVEVNTPLHPTGWAITYDGVNVSLRPSVGNWSEDCGSHYIIDKNRVRWGPVVVTSGNLGGAKHAAR